MPITIITAPVFGDGPGVCFSHHFRHELSNISSCDEQQWNAEQTETDGENSACVRSWRDPFIT